MREHSNWGQQCSGCGSRCLPARRSSVRRRAGAVGTPAFRPSSSRIPPGSAAQCLCGGPCHYFCRFCRDCSHYAMLFLEGSKGPTLVENCNRKREAQGTSNRRKFKAGLRKVPIPSILADPSESQNCSGREQYMDTHTAASALGGFSLLLHFWVRRRDTFCLHLCLGDCWVTYTPVKTLQNTVTGKDIKRI